MPVQLHRRQQLMQQQQQDNDDEEEAEIEKLYDTLLDVAQVEQGTLTRELLRKKLNVKPLKSKYMVFENDFMWQCDTKIVPPNASPYDRILVCVDASTRRCDAEPLRDGTAETAWIAFTHINNRGKISEYSPKVLYVDGGGEFERGFKTLANRDNIKVRQTVAGRKSQNAIVEHVNGLIGFGLMSNAYRMQTQQQGNRQLQHPRPLQSIDLFADNILSKIINKINKWASQNYPKPAKQWFKFDFDYDDTDMRIGDEVYIPKLNSTRMRNRYGQHKYMNVPFVITNIFSPTLKNEPYRFMTSFSDKITFKRDEIIKASDFIKNGIMIEFD